MLLAQLKVHLEHIGHLLAREAVEGRKGMALQERLDLGSCVCRVLFGISSPLRGDAVQLKLGAAGTCITGEGHLPSCA